MSLKFVTICFEKDKAWTIPCKISAILEIENDFKNYIKVILPGDRKYETFLASSVVKYGEKLYIASMKGEIFYSYNVSDGNLKKIILNGQWKEKEINDDIGFMASVIVDNEVYFIGKGYPGIININAERECANIYNLDETLIKECKGSYPGYMGSHVAVIGRKLYIPVCNNSKLYIFDTLDKKGETKNFDKAYVSADFDGKKIWLIPQERGSIKVWDPYGNEFQDIENFPDGFMGNGKRHFNMGLYQNGSVWIFPSCSNMIIKIDADTLQMKCIKKWDDHVFVRYVNAGVVDKQRIWGLYLPESRIDIIDTTTEKMESRFIECPANIDEYIEQVAYINDGGFFYDEDLFTLKNFIKKVDAGPAFLTSTNTDKILGKRIYDNILGSKRLRV